MILKIDEAKAPITMIPSNPMLTTPLRSEKDPAIAVKIKGAEYIKELVTNNCKIPIISIILLLLQFQHHADLVLFYTQFSQRSIQISSMILQRIQLTQ